jgi:flagellar biosynthesis protein FliQ
MWDYIKYLVKCVLWCDKIITINKNWDLTFKAFQVIVFFGIELEWSSKFTTWGCGKREPRAMPSTTPIILGTPQKMLWNFSYHDQEEGGALIALHASCSSRYFSLILVVSILLLSAWHLIRECCIDFVDKFLSIFCCHWLFLILLMLLLPQINHHLKFFIRPLFPINLRLHPMFRGIQPEFTLKPNLKLKGWEKKLKFEKTLPPKKN